MLYFNSVSGETLSASYVYYYK